MKTPHKKLLPAMLSFLLSACASHPPPVLLYEAAAPKPAAHPDKDEIIARQQRFIGEFSAAPRYGRGATRSIRLIEEGLADLGLEPIRRDYLRQKVKGVNVVATLRSSTPSAGMIIIGAHYDTVADSRGAHDNASGVALLLEVARVLRAAQNRTRDIEFVFFDGEEMFRGVGLRGSRAYLEDLRRSSQEEYVETVHIFDMVGYDSGDAEAWGIELHCASRAGLAQIYAKHASARLFEAIYEVPCGQVSTDHEPFVEAALPALAVTYQHVSDRPDPNWHKPGDTAEKLNFSYLAESTLLATDVITELATR